MNLGAQDRRDQRGAATLETVGAALIAAILVVAVVLSVTPQAKVISETFSYAICQVVTVGQGPCEPPSTSPEAHKPDEPCVVTQDGIEAKIGRAHV